MILLFLVVLITPIVVQLTGVEKFLLEDKNTVLDPPPKIEFDNLFGTIKETKNYYSNNFGMKITLFEGYKNFTQNVFKDDPIPNKVITGLDGWLFLGDSDSNALFEPLGFLNFSEHELRQIKSSILTQKKWLDEMGIKYYISIAPSKHTIYRKYLPFNPAVHITKLDVLSKYLKTQIDFDLIDLKGYVYQKKDSINLFYKHDTHWNDYGAYLGYKKLIDIIQEDFPILKEQRINDSDIIELNEREYVLGDLNRMLNNYSIKEERTIYNISSKSNVREEGKGINAKNYLFNDQDLYEKYVCNNKKLKILIFRDSFSTALRKYINETFGESIYIWHHKFDKKLIEEIKPDIVLFELGERKIENLISNRN